jgi:hypothetical protein
MAFLKNLSNPFGNRIWLTLLAAVIIFLPACELPFLGLTSAAPGTVLFQDDFTNPASGWLIGEDEIGLTEYAEDGFRIFVRSSTAAKVAIPRLQFKDVRMEVLARKSEGPDDNDYGLVCRYRDQDNFYFLTISSDGYYGIGKYKENELVLIGMEKMQTSDHIHQGNTVNHLRADCIGDRLSLYVNGQKIGEVQDSDFQTGDVGLIAGTFNTPGTDILFEKFIVLQP